ncbi:MAG: alpha-L-arabinofuranosidase C-terminal domain-containing protein [Candidatus Hinthialibacter antarcticus]|nr:alpha-L-arabinofuranosidase C-terminal domain-containing protein [Candidatus Hinthialibacter antarcticus]
MKKRFITTLLAVTMLILPCIAAAEESVTIHVNKTGFPISKYIYGQFIEHLGRCIYGGIWAEMLEDRKFYYPVTDDYNPWKTTNEGGYWGGGDFKVVENSPWKVIGEANTVRMIERNAFVGEHTPEININQSSGIEQLELALRKGKEYDSYVIVSGDHSAAPIEVRLVWGDGESQREVFTIDSIGRDFVKHPFRFSAGADTEHGRLQIVGLGKGKFKIGTASLMPADNVKGFRPDTLQLMRELDSPVYRWPGGNFVSDYNWKDGIGDRDKRPPRKNPAWTGIEHNDVGIHEFMDLCEILNTEPFIAVNTGLGSIELAAEEVEYCNGSTDTPMGKLRAENGREKPYNVIWWAVGNEMYGDWQKGHMPLEEYVQKHNRCAEMMYSVDPTIQLIGVGAVGNWTETMLKVCSGHMDLLSEHIYQKSKDDLVEHVSLIPNAIKHVGEAHRKYRKDIDGLAPKDIRIAMDEWNYWYGHYKYGELGCQYHLQDGLGIAAGLHEYFRYSDVFFMANYAQTVNVIGAIKTSKTDAQFETTGLVLKMYRHHFGEIPIRILDAPEPLDIAAAWTADYKSITVAVVNPTEKFVDISVNLKGAFLQDVGRIWRIAGTDKMAHNTPGEPEVVSIKEEPVTWNQGKLTLSPISVSLYKFDLDN